MRCTKCGENKGEALFSRKAGRAATICKACVAKRAQERREEREAEAKATGQAYCSMCHKIKPWGEMKATRSCRVCIQVQTQRRKETGPSETPWNLDFDPWPGLRPINGVPAMHAQCCPVL